MSQPLAVTPESVQIITRALDYWLAVVQALDGFPNQTFLAEQVNILRAVKLGMGAEATRGQALQLALATFPLVGNSGRWADWLPLFEAIYGRFCTIDREQYGRFLGRLGQLYRLDNRVDEALHVHQTAVAVIAPLPPGSPIACEIAFQLAEDYRRLAQFELAQQHALAAWHSANAARQNGAWHAISWRAAAANSLGLIHEALLQLEAAADWFSKAIQLWQNLNRPVELGRALSNLGNVLRQQEKAEEALLAFHQALNQLDKTTLWLEKMIVQYNTAVLHFSQAQYDQAERLLRDLHLEMGRQPDAHPSLYAHTCHSLGNTILKHGRLAEAEPFLRQSLPLWRTLGDDLNLGNSLATLAELLGAQHRLDEARALYREALALLANQRATPRGKNLYQEFLAAFAALNC
ncbi:MAG: tetratricopeptide repeat protein [Anaerolineaceae bacterium]|nr:tetratricopeptide repeat protein [Anaerolineaceae bacterium]